MEIARLQEERLDILRRAIDAREEKAERVAEARLRRMRDGMLSEKHKKFASIQAKRLKALRKLGKNRAASFEDGDENKGSIVDEYADHASKKYVPDPVRGLVAHRRLTPPGTSSTASPTAPWTTRRRFTSPSRPRRTSGTRRRRWRACSRRERPR